MRWMCGHTRRDKIRNGEIQDKLVLAFVVDKMRAARLRWPRHVKRRCTDALVRRCERLAIVVHRRGGDRSRKY